ncbi:MAG: hypothetical protein KIT22_03975 [Verrucomicrobiae bacterium]|nr:hypothetical protein [Verrucomicrobiae bacterium]
MRSVPPDGGCGSALSLGKIMKAIAKADWNLVHELACEIANAAGVNDETLAASRQEELMRLLDDLQQKYGPCSRITATKADYTETNSEELYLEALRQAREEEDTENEKLILESLTELRNEKK